MNNLADSVADRTTRRMLQAAVAIAWAVVWFIALFSQTTVANFVLATASGVVALVALKVSLVDAASLAANGRARRSAISRITAEQAALRTVVNRLEEAPPPVVSDPDLREEMQTLSRLLEPYATLIELKEQQILALREQLERAG